MLSKEYISWAIDLMLSCIDLASEKSINKKRRKWIKADIDTLENKENELYSSFKRIAGSTDSSLDDTTIFGMYQRIVNYTMKAYAGFRNDMRNNPEKRLAKSLNNVKFRTLVQTGSRVVNKPKAKGEEEELERDDGRSEQKEQ